MTELERYALLPAGLRDTLPPDAGHEADVIERLVACFASHGYDRIKAPLVEFEDGLMSGAGAAISAETFRLMDPVSQRMMGVRADITPQIARIALTRMRGEPRPLRLSYAGEVLRVKGSQLRPERQFAQVGIELIGAETARADSEVIAVAVEALAGVGVPDISVDLTIPPLVPALCAGLELEAAEQQALRAALDRKDAAAVRALGGAAAAVLQALLAAAGPAQASLPVLEKLDLPPMAALERDRLEETVAQLSATLPGIRLTVDPVENRGFEYHTGIGFTIFTLTERSELGAGGRYLAASNGGGGEPATGFSLYVDTILRVLAEPKPVPRVFVPAECAEDARRLRGEGWITVAGLQAGIDPLDEARRMKCSHVWLNGKVTAVVE